jgi:hypothetical protein
VDGSDHPPVCVDGSGIDRRPADIQDCNHRWVAGAPRGRVAHDRHSTVSNCGVPRDPTM